MTGDLRRAGPGRRDARCDVLWRGVLWGGVLWGGVRGKAA
jgi:hypothetical protein